MSRPHQSVETEPDPMDDKMIPSPADLRVQNQKKAEITRAFIKYVVGKAQDPELKSLSHLQAWARTCEEIKKDHERTFVIGVAGTTGASKTSLISAMLGQANILPTTSTDATTAVPVEIRYNEITDPQKAYKVNVTFMAAERWEEVLDECIFEVKQANNAKGVFDTLTNVNLALICAVYPLSKDKIIALLECGKKAELKATRNLGFLGHRHGCCYSNADKLCRALFEFITTCNSSDDGLACWPLTTKVEVYLRIDFLKNIIIIDLPGLGDINAARRSGSSSYLSKIDHLLIATPIVGAIAGEVAYEIASDRIGQKFLQQGRLAQSFVSIVATKSDDLNVSEITESSPLHQYLKTTDFYRLQQDEVELEQKYENLSADLDSIEAYEKEFATTPHAVHGNQRWTHLVSIYAVAGEKNKIMKEIRRVDKDRKGVRNTYHRIAIQSRNRCVEANVKLQFESGLNKLLGEFRADNIWEAPGDTASMGAGKLNVFCVSAKTYLQQLGFWKKDDIAPGFNYRYDTNIPRLITFISSLVNTFTRNTQQLFVQETEAMVTQMRAWRDGQMAGENGDGMDVEAQKKLMAFFKTETERFYKDCQKPAQVCYTNVSKNIRNTVTRSLPDNELAAYNNLCKVAKDFFPPDTRIWRSICTHRGQYRAPKSRKVEYIGKQKSNTMYNLNYTIKELYLRPVSKRLWFALNIRAGEHSDVFDKEVESLIHDFCDIIEEEARRLNGNIQYEPLTKALTALKLQLKECIQSTSIKWIMKLTSADSRLEKAIQDRVQYHMQEHYTNVVSDRRPRVDRETRLKELYVYLDQEGEKMIQDCSKEMKTHIEIVKAESKRHLSECARPLTTQIRSTIKVSIDYKAPEDEKYIERDTIGIRRALANELRYKLDEFQADILEVDDARANVEEIAEE